MTSDPWWSGTYIQWIYRKCRFKFLSSISTFSNSEWWTIWLREH